MLLDITAMDQSTEKKMKIWFIILWNLYQSNCVIWWESRIQQKVPNVLDKERHCKHEVSYSVDHFQHLTNNIHHREFPMYFQSKLVVVAVFLLHKLLCMQTNHLISNNRLVLLFHLPIKCIRIVYQDFYSFL